MLTQPATYLFAIFAVERSSCLRHMMWTLDREPIFPRRRIEYFWLCGECAPAMLLMRTTDGSVSICQPSRPSDPLVALRIAFAREVTSPSWSTEGYWDLNLAKTRCVDSSVFDSVDTPTLRSPGRVFYGLTTIRRWKGTCNARKEREVGQRSSRGIL